MAFIEVTTAKNSRLILINVDQIVSIYDNNDNKLKIFTIDEPENPFIINESYNQVKTKLDQLNIKIK